MRRLSLALAALAGCSGSPGTSPAPHVPLERHHRRVPSLRVGRYPQEVARHYTTADGLPSNDVTAVAVLPNGTVYAGTDKGLSRFAGRRWEDAGGARDAHVRALLPQGDDLWILAGRDVLCLRNGTTLRIAAADDARSFAVDRGTVYVGTDTRLLAGADRALAEVGPVNAMATSIRHVAARDGAVAVASGSGLIVKEGEAWKRTAPHDGRRGGSLEDARGAAFDAGGLWVIGSEGLGRLERGAWKLWTAEDGLPVDDLAALAPGEPGVVWLGTPKGAVRFDGTTWEYRAGRRWLPHDEVRSIAVTKEGHAWFATPAGVGLIERRPLTLAEKARYFEEEIDKRHRRTPYGYVNGVHLPRPGDAREWVRHDSDNDGLWTAMYGAGECFAYAATKDPEARRRAQAAFEALRFLSRVTQGGTHPAPRGYPARTILPTDGENPNERRYTLERDRETRSTRDRLWKLLHPRWPVSADGKWYWKADTSSDELDGHYFFYAQYYDLVADGEEERARVREVVTALTDHLIGHDFRLVDWDGKPTRWGNYNPADLNQNPDWWIERGLNSLSMISYLKVAERVSGDPKYRDAAERLIREHHYATNLMVPKVHSGPGSGNQSDDEMAFMGFYNLLLYERDPVRRPMYARAFWGYWQLERFELNPFFNFAYAAVGQGETFRTPHRTLDLSPDGEWLAESVDTLKRFPLDRFRWTVRNSHRKDVVPTPFKGRHGDAAPRGMRRDGRVLPVDERWVEHWNVDPWRLDDPGEGTELWDGAAFLLPYYMGLYHGFIRED